MTGVQTCALPIWLTSVLVQTGIKTNPDAITGSNVDYFREPAKRNEDADYFIGQPLAYFKGQCRETFVQVMNTAFPAGLMTAAEATDKMDESCFGG